MISYGIQGLTATLFGSLVMALRATFLRSSSNTNRPSLHRSFRQASRVAQHTIQTNNTLTWSIMIATAVRMRQDVPIAEQWFLARLVRYQMLLSFMTCAASIAILERHVSSSVHIVITYALLRCIRSAATLLEERREGLGSVGKYCAASREGVADDSDGFASSAFAIGFWSTLSVIVFSGFRHIGPLRAYLGGPSDGYVIALFVAYTLCSGGTLIVLLWDMQLHRRDLRSMAGVAYEDDEWGFGQVMAVLLWVPLLQTLVKGLPGFFERQFDRVFDWVWWWIHPDNRT